MAAAAGMKAQSDSLTCPLCVLYLAAFSSLFTRAETQGVSAGAGAGDASVMLALRQSLNPPEELGWSDPDPCKWPHVGCSADRRVTRIQIGRQNLRGTLPPDFSPLSQLQRLELQYNEISGPIPRLSGLNSLQVVMLSNNLLTSFPADFFSGLSSLRSIEVDNNPFSSWQIPDGIRNSTALQNFSANSANIRGKIPNFFGPDQFPGLQNLHLAFNNLEGGLPACFSGSQIQSLWVNGQKGGKLGGAIDVVQNMSSLVEIWLHSNRFTGPLPDFSGLKNLEVLSARDNQFTGIVPLSLVNLASLKVVNLTNNMLQGPTPAFSSSVAADMIAETNSFCLPNPGDCSALVNTLLSIAKSFEYPTEFASGWKGNDPCADWSGITCSHGNITVINFEKMGLGGTISPRFSSLESLQRLLLCGNNITGIIPQELTALPSLTQLDVSSNRLSGKVPSFNSNVVVKTAGNPAIVGEEASSEPSWSSDTSASSPSAVNPHSPNDGGGGPGHKSTVRVLVIACSVAGGFLVMLVISFAGFCLFKRKQRRLTRVQSPNATVVHPHHSGPDNDSVKVAVAGSSLGGGAIGDSHTVPRSEAGNMMISIQVLRNVTNNFSEENVLGQGGFGTVYKGELHDGTKIAVKRMECGVITGKGVTEFKSEISVLTKVRHRHLVALLGYCLDGNEKLLVYEYMPQGTLGEHLFNRAAAEGLKPLEWTKRLTIALDVARGVEYLHGLAHQSFIHRDLKPSNILLGDDMRAKVGDFGLVRLAPEGKGSIETRIAGTFGYLAPEYAVTGRVTTKVDVYSFGVILMELITGRKALDERQPEESAHLVTWFKRMHISKEAFRKAIDPSIDLDEDTLSSMNTVAELAGHCCTREPYQRPDMGHAVNVLSSLVELWKPAEPNSDDIYGIDLEMSLPQALKKWQAFEGRSDADSPSSLSHFGSLDNSQTSLPSRPWGFADTFTSSDGR